MKDWYHTFAEDLWLKPDDVGIEEATFVKKALRLRRGQSVLDAPCGAGRIAIHLAHAGCHVTGIDLKRAFINRAEIRFRREEQKGNFIHMDVRNITFAQEFHGIYNWQGSFGYFSDSENLDVMKRYARALRRGGRILVDQPNRESILRHFEPLLEINNLTIRNQWIPQAQRMECDWIVHKNKRKQHNRISMRLYTALQMHNLFEQAGFSIESVFGSIDGEPYRRSSKRLIIIGKK